jgi:hypothetical protein
MEMELGKLNEDKMNALASLQKYSQEYTNVSAAKEELEYKYQRDQFAHKATEKQLLEALAQQQRSSEDVKNLLAAQKELSRKWKEESRNTIGKYERLLNELRQENEVLEKRNSEMAEELEGMLCYHL